MAFTRRDFVAALMLTGAGATQTVAQSGTKKKGSGKGKAKIKRVFVVAEITVKPGKRDEFVKIFKDNVPDVLAEDGCIFYEPVVDFDSGIGAQGEVREEVMTVMEKWASIDHLKAHLKAPHMDTYREKVKDMVAGVTLRVMQPA
jgi:quinol monooxygenase YgiN